MPFDFKARRLTLNNPITTEHNFSCHPTYFARSPHGE
jgi:hypothetical protein